MAPAPIWTSSRYRPLSCIPTSVLISSALLWPIWRCRRRCSRIPNRLRRPTGVHLRDRQVAPDDSGRRVSTPPVEFGRRGETPYGLIERPDQVRQSEPPSPSPSSLSSADG